MATFASLIKAKLFGRKPYPTTFPPAIGEPWHSYAKVYGTQFLGSTGRRLDPYASIKLTDSLVEALKANLPQTRTTTFFADQGVELSLRGSIKEYAELHRIIADYVNYWGLDPSIDIATPISLLHTLYVKAGYGIKGINKIFSHCGDSHFNLMISDKNTLWVMRNDPDWEISLLDMREKMGEMYVTWDSAVLKGHGSALSGLGTQEVWEIHCPENVHPKNFGWWKFHRYYMTGRPRIPSIGTWHWE